MNPSHESTKQFDPTAVRSIRACTQGKPNKRFGSRVERTQTGQDSVERSAAAWVGGRWI